MANFDSALYFSYLHSVPASFYLMVQRLTHGLFLSIVISSKILNLEASLKVPSLSCCSRPDEPVFALQPDICLPSLLPFPNFFSGLWFSISHWPVKVAWTLPFNFFSIKDFYGDLGLKVDAGKIEVMHSEIYKAWVLTGNCNYAISKWIFSQSKNVFLLFLITKPM